MVTKTIQGPVHQSHIFFFFFGKMVKVRDLVFQCGCDVLEVPQLFQPTEKKHAPAKWATHLVRKK